MLRIMFSPFFFCAYPSISSIICINLSLTFKSLNTMLPYFEFYSELDLIIKGLEELHRKCREFWINDKPFKIPENLDPEYWYTLMDAIDEVLDKLNDEPFFTTEE